MAVSREEWRALLALAGLILLGSLVRLAQSVRPDLAPELIPLAAVGADSAVAAGAAPAAARAESASSAEPVSTGADAETAPSSPFAAGLLDLNAATSEDLTALPGIGPRLAERIVADRLSRGPFQSVDDLDRVSGIGPATIRRFRGAVFVRPPAGAPVR
jgi:competence protein ComEA